MEEILNTFLLEGAKWLAPDLQEAIKYLQQENKRLKESLENWKEYAEIYKGERDTFRRLCLSILNKQ